MSTLNKYRELFEYEKDSNARMLRMIESVPATRRGDARFQRAINIAAHLAACRENWLDFIATGTGGSSEWMPSDATASSLAARFAALEAAWTEFLAGLDDDKLSSDFSFTEGAGTWSLPTEAQILQLVLHTCYHRGQVVLLVDQLGGETEDTDYIYWKVPESR